MVSNWFRNQGIPYSELLYDVAGHLKISAIEPLDKLTTSGLTIAEMDKRAMQGIVSPDVSRSWREPLNRYILGLEQEILKKFMSDSYGNMSAAERMRIDEQVAELGKTLPGTGVLGLSGAAAFMVVANAGGFATYILMSSVISALTVGAGFGLYTAAASTLNVLLGPVGWAALGIASAYKLGGPDAQACVKAVLALAMLRGRAIKA